VAVTAADGDSSPEPLQLILRVEAARSVQVKHSLDRGPVWLPVPRMPAMCQVRSMVTKAADE
jgi:hypothetical protein